MDKDCILTKETLLKLASKYGIYLALMGMAFLALWPYMPPSFYVNRDSGIFLYGGQQIILGKILYVDFFDHKGPLLFYINALGIFLGQRVGVWFLEWVFLSASVIIGYLIIRKLLTAKLAIWGSIAWLYSFMVIIGGGNFSEEYSLPLNFLGIFLFDQQIKKERSQFLVLIGVLIGLNILLRANNSGIQLVMVAIILAQNFFQSGIAKFFRNLFLVFAGVLFVIVPVFVFFYAKGAFNEFIYSVFTFNLNYANDPNFSKFSGVPLFILALGWPCWFAIGGWFLMLADVWRKQYRLPLHLTLLYLVGFPLEFLLDTVTGRPYPHYVLLLLPYFGLLNAFFLSCFIQFIRKHQNQIVKLALPPAYIFTVFFSIWIGMQFVQKINSVSVGINENSQIVQFVKAQTLKTDKVLVWGQEPSINFLAQRESPTAYAHQTYFLVGVDGTSEMEKDFLLGIEKNKPALIVITDELPFSDVIDESFERQLKLFSADTGNTFRAFSEYVRKYYEQVNTIHGWQIYMLRHSLSQR